MTPSLKISQKIIDRLSHSIDDNFGKVYGIVSKNNLIILQLQIDVEDGNKNLINSLPAEIYLCGVIQIGDGNFDDQSIKQRLTEVYVTDNPIFIYYNTQTGQITARFYINGQLGNTTFSAISEQEILSQFLYIHLNANVPLTCELAINNIKESFTNLRKNIASGVMSFGFIKNNIFLLGADSENGVVGVSGNPTINELCEDTTDSSEGGRRKKAQQYGIEIIEANMYKKMTKENGISRGKEHAPLCVLDKKQCKTINFTITIDTLAIVHRQTKIANIHEILVESAIRNLRLIENAIVDNYENMSQPEIFHFYPEECGHFLTKVYLRNINEDSLIPERKSLHKELLLSEDKPLFRRSNRYIFRGKTQVGEPLINPHLGVKPTDNSGRIAIVRGKYSYYHYCQNKMDDNGWGCAYRSLQTLASWFKHQGYTDKEVPSFTDIQKSLVEIGDKPASFIGSKQWIGSTEVSYVLNTLLGVTSKILYVSSGEEMGTKGPELVSHFETNGSPVMIGGGVLAHTILGVDYNSQSGNLKFLILDPHYTGSEDLHTIQNKGWCGWKGVDFWDKTAYYNMCLPQVPKGI